jgi:hypothetical protein
LLIADPAKPVLNFRDEAVEDVLLRNSVNICGVAIAMEIAKADRKLLASGKSRSGGVD